MMQRAASVRALCIGISAVFQEVSRTFQIVPVMLPDEHQGEILFREPACFNQQLQRTIVIRRVRVVHDLDVIRICASLKQEARHFRVMRLARTQVCVRRRA